NHSFPKKGELSFLTKLSPANFFRKSSIAPTRGASVPFVNYLVFNNTPHWVPLKGMQSFIDRFYINPVLYSCIMIKVREAGNKRIGVRNKKTLEIEPRSTNESIPKKLYRLLDQPNPDQSSKEFFQERKMIEQVTGNKIT